MADPIQRAQAGTPFRPSASAWNRMLDASRSFDSGAGLPGGAAVPYCLVRVRNDTGADLAAFTVLALGASILEITDPVLVSPTPMFEGTTPAATSDAFAILIEPAPEDEFALAAVAGVVPVEVNVTDAGHGYATPTAASSARLTSAASGPARIIDRETGTGNVSAVVSLVGTGSATAFSGCRVYFPGPPEIGPTTTQSIPNNTLTYLSFVDEKFDTDGYHDNSTNPSRLTVPTTGYYAIGGTVSFASNATGYRSFGIHKDGNTAPNGAIGEGFTVNAVNGVSTTGSFSGVVQVNAGSYFEIAVVQNSGGALNVEGIGTNFWIQRVG